MKMKKLIAAALTSIIAITSIPVTASVYAAETGIRGDANQNGKTDVRDCAYIAKMLAAQKSSSLPEDADYNRDNKKNVRDAAELAKDLSIGQVKIYGSAPIIAGIHNGMTEEEVFAVVGRNYSFKESGFLNPDETKYDYSLNSVDVFGLNMSAIMFFDFSSEGKLYNFGYHIGSIRKSKTEYSYPYSKSDLLSAYDKIYSYLKGWYGDGKETSNNYYGVLKEYLWNNTDYGEVFFIVGMDLWGENSGMNEITLSSSDQVIRNWSPS